MAIAYDQSLGNNSGNSTSPSLASVAPSGTDRLLVCCILAEASGTTVTTGPAFGGSNFTQMGSYLSTGDGALSFSVWYLVAPSTSSGSITATLSGSTPWNIWAQSYTGVDQSNPLVNTASGGASGSITTSPTDVVVASARNGSWHFVAAKEDSAATALTVSAGGTRRQVGPGGTVTMAMADSNATIANGANSTITLAWTGGGQRLGYITSMLQEVASASGPANLKSYNTNLKANITSINTNLIANVKSVDTNA